MWILSKYKAAFLKNVGLSRKQPRPRLQFPHSRPRTTLVVWSWSTVNFIAFKQIAQRFFCLFVSVSRLSADNPYSDLRRILFVFSGLFRRHSAVLALSFFRYASSLLMRSWFLARHSRADFAFCSLFLIELE